MPVRTILERVEEWLWNIDSDDTDDNSMLEIESANDGGHVILRDEFDGRFYRLENSDVNTIADGDITEVKPYQVMVTRFK